MLGGHHTGLKEKLMYNTVSLGAWWSTSTVGWAIYKVNAKKRNIKSHAIGLGLLAITGGYL